MWEWLGTGEMVWWWFCGRRSPSGRHRSRKVDETRAFKGSAQGAREASPSSTAPSSSEMSVRPFSNSEMESREGGSEESEEQEEKEGGNMKID